MIVYVYDNSQQLADRSKEQGLADFKGYTWAQEPQAAIYEVQAKDFERFDNLAHELGCTEVYSLV